jgi:tetratricopeptide (TPR) repeat protein
MNGINRWTGWSLACVAAALLCAGLLLQPRTGRADDLKDGRAALQAGRLDDALKSFEKAAAQGYAEGRSGVGQVWLRRRQYAQALEAFQLAQKMDPLLAFAYYGQAEVHRRQGRCGDAVPLYQKATELDRRFPEAQLALGNCLVELKQHQRAVAALSDGLKWGPKWRPRFLVALGNAEMARDSLRPAGIYFTQAREEAPNDAAPRRALGDFYLKRGIPGLAIPEYQAAVSLDTADVELHYALGQALYYDQRYNDALREYQLVVDRDPEFSPGQLALGNLFYLSGKADKKRYPDARAPLEKYTQMEPSDPRGWSVLGRTYYYLGMKDEAVTALKKAEEMGETSKEAYTVLGRAYSERREWESALAAYARGEPTTADQLRMAQMYAFLKNEAKSDSIYQQIVAADSTGSDARFALNEMGKLRFRRQDYAGALQIFQRRIALDPSNDEAYYYVGLSYKELKQYPEALAALREAAALGEGKADRHFWLGILYAQQDSAEAARRSFLRSVELDSTSKTASVAYQQLGYYRLLERDYPQAVRYLERAVQTNDQNLQAWVWLGQGYQNSGNRTRALECYNRALALDPKQSDALKGKQSLAAQAPR